MNVKSLECCFLLISIPLN